jgi:tetratricopeptide (TPR) repeat protein
MTEQKIDTRSADRRAAASEPHAAVSIDEIIAAATALAWAARWDIAARLLTSAQAPGLDDATVRRLALARAAVSVHHDFRTDGARWAPAAMTAAESAADPADPAGRRQLEQLRLQYDYEIMLTGSDGTPRFGPQGHDPARLAGLAQRAEQLADATTDVTTDVAADATADVAGAGWAAFYRGLIADNLIGDRDGAPRWFARALDAAERADDDYLAGEALRHLGDHETESGDLTAARASWERSAELWAGIGNVTGVLAQQLLLADLAFREGNAPGGAAIAGEVSRWAGAAGLARYRSSADELIESHRPQH